MRWNIIILTLLLFINQFQREFWYNSNISCTSSAAAGARLSSDTEQQWENARREKAAQSRFLSMNERSWYVAQLNVWDGCTMYVAFNETGLGILTQQGWKMFIYHIIVLEPITRRRRKDFKPSPNSSTTPPKSHNFLICAKIRTLWTLFHLKQWHVYKVLVSSKKTGRVWFG